MRHFTLAAFSAQRRTVAIAMFHGTQLEGLRIRRLLQERSKAAGSARQAVLRTLEQYRPDFFAIACPSSKAGNHVRTLCDVAREVASGLAIPTIEVDDEVLKSAYGHPPLTRKEHVRKTGRAIWPSLNDPRSGSAGVDAATVGLYIQAERLFKMHEEAA